MTLFAPCALPHCYTLFPVPTSYHCHSMQLLACWIKRTTRLRGDAALLPTNASHHCRTSLRTHFNRVDVGHAAVPSVLRSHAFWLFAPFGLPPRASNRCNTHMAAHGPFTTTTRRAFHARVRRSWVAYNAAFLVPPPPPLPFRRRVTPDGHYRRAIALRASLVLLAPRIPRALTHRRLATTAGRYYHAAPTPLLIPPVVT